MKILVLNAEANFLFLIKSVHLVLETSYICLKGQLDPPVSNGHVFCTKGGQLDPPVSNDHVFCPKQNNRCGKVVVNIPEKGGRIKRRKIFEKNWIFFYNGQGK